VLTGVSAVLDREAAHGPVTLVGHSLGAWIACLYAAQNPARVARVILVNGGPLRGDRDDLSLMPANRAEAARLLAEMTDSGSRRIPGFVLDDMIREARRGGIARLAMAAGSMEKHVLDGRLNSVSVPVDLLWGQSDRVMSMDYARRVAAGLPAARLTAIPRCGHVPQQECASRFLATLRAVLAAPPPSNPAEPGTRGEQATGSAAAGSGGKSETKR
jgi:pimeloyl-ACP methyl ester carboxylesterase